MSPSMNTNVTLYRKFRWEWRFALLMGTLFLIFVSLGNWQLRREQEKRHIMTEVQSALQAPPMDFTGDEDDTKLAAFQPVRVTGRYLNDRQFLLDNQYSNHRVGYDVITPMRVGQYIVLVNRGWVPRGQSREDLPILKAVEGPQSVVGLLTKPTSKPLRLSRLEDNPTQWPRVIETLDWGQIGEDLHQPVLPFTVRMNATEPNGYVRDWSLSWMSPERHRAYAVQWFLFAGIAVVIFFGLSFKSPLPRAGEG
jgi:surfeit locus 1 family protein